MKRYVCLRFPHWPLQRWYVASGGARKVWERAPWVVLQGGDARRGEWVVDCSQAAWECGVRVGMPLGEARSLVRRRGERAGDGPRVERHDPALDREALRELAERCERFSPCVGWETVVGAGRDKRGSSTIQADARPAHLWLDITGIGRLFGGEEQLLAELRAALEGWGYVGIGAVADTLGAAWACAEAAWPVVPAGGNRQAVGARPLASLRLPAKVLSELEQLGVERVEQLWRLPRAGLATRWGEELLRRLDQVLGAAPEWLVPLRPVARFQLDWWLEEPVADRAWIERWVEKALHQLSAQVRAAGQGALELRGRLDCEAGEPVEWQVGLFRPSACPQHWQSLVRLQWERRVWPGAVGRLGVQVVATAPLRERQQELFPRGESVAEGTVGALWERLANRLGKVAVWRPRMVPAAVPERAWVREPILEPTRGEPLRRNRRKKEEDQEGWRRALRSGVVGEGEVIEAVGFRPGELLPSPFRLDIVASPGSAVPQRFFWEQCWWQVVAAWGPERIETGWWRGESVRREYYRVETSEGDRFWIFRDLSSSQWFLQGFFD